jgi:hypothetical protein
MIIFGGFEKGKETNKVLIYNFIEEEWSYNISNQ